jgi:predicted acyl esterase
MEKKFASERDSFEAWPSSRLKSKVFYLHPRKNILDYDGEIKTGTYYSSTLLNPTGAVTNTINHFYPLADTIATTGIPEVSQILESYVDIPLTVLVDVISTEKALVFKSDRFSSGLKIRGIAKLHLNVAFSGGKGILVAYLYDNSDDGIGKLLTHGVYGAYNWTAGKNQTIDMELAAQAYDLPAGHRLAIVIDTDDPLYGQPVNSYYAEKFSFSNSLQSRFEIPTVD